MVKSIIQDVNVRLKLHYRNQFFYMHSHVIDKYSFDYACSVWYPGLSQFLRNRLQTTLNNILKIFLNTGHIIGHIGWLLISKNM